MNKIISRKQILLFLFFVMFLLACFQNIKVVNFGNFSIKAFHVFSLVFLPYLFKQKKVKMELGILLYILYIFIISLINYKVFSINSLILNYVFGFYVIVVIENLASDFTSKNWLNILSKASFFIMFAVYIKNIFEFDKFIYFFKYPDFGHPSISTFFGGGVNLEATWIGMFTFFIVGNKKRWLYLFFSILISALYCSRAGIIVNIISIIWIIYPKLKNKSFLFLILLLFPFVLFLISKIGLFDLLFARFLESGEDMGSQGRLRMWNYVYDTIKTYPFGCGIGNSVKAIATISGLIYSDGNLHNVYLQNFIDLGIFGGITYLLFIIKFIFNHYKKFFADPFVAFLFTYCILSIIEFRGGDSIVFFVFAIILNFKHIERGRYYVN